MRSRRCKGALGVVVMLAFAYVMLPTAALATTFQTVVTCESVSACSQSTTDPASGAGKVTILGGGAGAAQVFHVTRAAGVTIEKVEATFSDGTKETRDPAETDHIFTGLSATRFVTRFDVTWNDTATSTTSPSTSSTTSSPTSSTSSTSTSSTSTSTSTSTTTTTTLPPVPSGPGFGPVAIRDDGNVQSSPDSASVIGQERVDVVVRGTDGFYWTFWAGSGWSNWFGLGGPSSGSGGDPTIVSWGPGRLDVFVRGANDGRLWQTYSEDGGATWSGWLKTFGDDGEIGSGTSPEASSRGPGRLDIFVTGTNGRIYQRFYDGDWNDAWLDHLGPPAVTVVGEPTTTSWDSTRVDVFVRGSDNKLWQRSWDGAQWSAWGQPVGSNGVLASSPEATSWAPGTLLVFVRGTDNFIYALPYGGRWGTWERLSTAAAKTNYSVGASSRGEGRFDVFYRGADNKAYHIWQ